jgi:hypothetical protein
MAAWCMAISIPFDKTLVKYNLTFTIPFSLTLQENNKTSKNSKTQLWKNIELGKIHKFKTQKQTHKNVERQGSSKKKDKARLRKQRSRKAGSRTQSRSRSRKHLETIPLENYKVRKGL